MESSNQEKDKLIILCEELLSKCGGNELDNSYLDYLDSKDAEFECISLVFKETKTILDYHKGMQNFLKVLPDFDMKFENQVRVGDLVYLVERGTATFTGENFWGNEANGKPMKWFTIWQFILKNGKIVKALKGWDQQATFVQVGWEGPK